MEKINVYIEEGLEVSGIDTNKFNLINGLSGAYMDKKPCIIAGSSVYALEILFKAQNNRNRATAIAFIDSNPSAVYGTIYLHRAIYVLSAKNVGDAIRVMKNKSWWDRDHNNFMDDFNKGGD